MVERLGGRLGVACVVIGLLALCALELQDMISSYGVCSFAVFQFVCFGGGQPLLSPVGESQRSSAKLGTKLVDFFVATLFLLPGAEPLRMIN